MQRIWELPEDRLTSSVRDGLHHNGVFVDEPGPRQRLGELGPPQAMISPPGCLLSAPISSARSPRAMVDFGQLASLSVFENTTFGISFIGAA